jgi:hypothetical protein
MIFNAALLKSIIVENQKSKDPHGHRKSWGSGRSACEARFSCPAAEQAYETAAIQAV